MPEAIRIVHMHQLEIHKGYMFTPLTWTDDTHSPPNGLGSNGVVSRHHDYLFGCHENFKIKKNYAREFPFSLVQC